MHTPTFTATLCIMAKIWNQPKCPLIDEWILTLCQLLHMDKADTKKISYIYVYIYVYIYGILFSYKNDILLFVTTWMDLKGIVLNEINQTETNTVK